MSLAIVEQQDATLVAEVSPPKTWRNAVANILVAVGGVGTLAWMVYLAWIVEEAVRASFS